MSTKFPTINWKDRKSSKNAEIVVGQWHDDDTNQPIKWSKPATEIGSRRFGHHQIGECPAFSMETWPKRKGIPQPSQCKGRSVIIRTANGVYHDRLRNEAC